MPNLAPRLFWPVQQRRSVTTALLTVIVSVLSISTATSQDRRWSVQLVPTIGWYDATQPISVVPAAPGDDVQSLVFSGSPTAGLALTVGSPLDFLGFRLIGLFSRPDLAVRSFDRFTSCGSACIRILDRQSPAGQSLIGVVAGDVLFKAPRTWTVSPFAAIGAGVKKYNLEFDAAGDALPGIRDGDYTDATGHFAVGVAVRAKRLHLTAEAGDYFSSFRYRTGAQPGDDRGAVGFGQRQHDLALTIGAAFDAR